MGIFSQAYALLYFKKMKKIPLPRNKFAIVNDEDYDNLIRYKWHTHNRGYVRRNERKNGKYYRNILMSRVIAGAKEGEQVDHINHDTLDNRRCNLRIASPSENQGNKLKLKNNTSGFKGVSWHKASNRWSAHIGFRGKQYHLGVFYDKKKAAQAYNKSAIKYFGEFAVLNEL